MSRLMRRLVAFLLTVTIILAVAALPVSQLQDAGVAANGMPERALATAPAADPDRQFATSETACTSTAPESDATPRPDTSVGLELVLEMHPAPGQPLDTSTLIGIRTVLQRRLELLDVSGEVMRRYDGRILVRVNATEDPGRLAPAIARTMLLEIIDPQGESLTPGRLVATTLGPPGAIDPDSSATPATPSGGDRPIFETIISGADFTDVYVTSSATSELEVVGFNLDEDAAIRFYEYTSTHIHQPMSIILDKRVISSPYIIGAIATSGLIEGIPADQVPLLVAQLRAGALAVPLTLVECRIVPAVGTT